MGAAVSPWWTARAHPWWIAPPWLIWLKRFTPLCWTKAVRTGAARRKLLRCPQREYTQLRRLPAYWVRHIWIETMESGEIAVLHTEWCNTKTDAAGFGSISSCNYCGYCCKKTERKCLQKFGFHWWYYALWELLEHFLFLYAQQPFLQSPTNHTQNIIPALIYRCGCQQIALAL